MKILFARSLITFIVGMTLSIADAADLPSMKIYGFGSAWIDANPDKAKADAANKAYAAVMEKIKGSSFKETCEAGAPENINKVVLTEPTERIEKIWELRRGNNTWYNSEKYEVRAGFTLTCSPIDTPTQATPVALPAIIEE